MTDSVTVTTPYQSLQAWLLITGTGPGAGIAGWECEVRTRTAGPVPIVLWQIQGDHFSLAPPPLFLVGMNAPHPWSSVIAVAQATVLLPDPGYELSFFLLPYPEPAYLDPVSHYPVQRPAATLEGGGMVPLRVSSGSSLDQVAVVNDDGLDPPAPEWSTPSSRIVFGDVEPGGGSFRQARIYNDGNEDLFGTLTLSMIDATYQHGVGSYTSETTDFRIAPSQTYLVSLQFQPVSSPVSEGTLTVTVGDRESIIRLQGGVDCFANYQDIPLQFGDVPVGGTRIRGATIYNHGSAPVDATPFFPYPSNDFTFALSDSTVDPAALPAGSALSVRITFAPTVPGARTDLIRFGDHCGEVILEGVGVDVPPVCSVDRTDLAFQGVLVGDSRPFPLTITNTGGGLLAGAVQMVDPDGAFAVAGGDLTYALAYNQSRTFELVFAPPRSGSFSATLVTGSGCDPVEMRGYGVASAFTVVPPDLDFGVEAIGRTVAREIVVTNDSADLLQFSFFPPGYPFFVDPVIVNVAAGTQVAVPVTFSPTEFGPASGLIQVLQVNLSNFLDPITCRGFGVDTLPGAQNRLGFYFGAPFSPEAREVDVAAGTTIPGFLVLHDPTAPVGGWEMCLRFAGDASPLSWTFAGSPAGDLGPECFRLTLQSPLPPAAAVVLMTGDILVPSLLPSTILLDQPESPAIPGYASFIDGGNPARHLPLGLPGQAVELAWINRRSVAVDAPSTPTARVTGGAVELRWSCGDDPAEGYHVWRRSGEGEFTRLTVAPVSCTDGFGSFIDRPEAGTGSMVSYALSAVRGGEESALSVAAEVTLDGGPPQRTRLLASYPNPFNPQTTVPFIMAEPGHARLVVYDLAGRLVKVLLDETVPAGLQEKVWLGRNARGRPVPSGVYYLRLDAAGRVDMGKTMLLK
ncbi:MAG: choice-of-anchor D domain-containing protein [bacterium]